MRWVLLIPILTFAGCVSDPPRPSYVPTTRPVATGLPSPTADPLLHATVAPPIGWLPSPPKTSDRHRHQTWVSPGQSTAYGVIAFKLPIPVGPGLALWGVLREMRNKEGQADVVDRHDDPALPGIRFTVDAGRYRVRGNLTTDGLRGWVVYAGTLRAKPVNAADLKLAEQAREATRVDLP